MDEIDFSIFEDSLKESWNNKNFLLDVIEENTPILYQYINKETCNNHNFISNDNLINKNLYMTFIKEGKIDPLKVAYIYKDNMQVIATLWRDLFEKKYDNSQFNVIEKAKLAASNSKARMKEGKTEEEYLNQWINTFTSLKKQSEDIGKFFNQHIFNSDENALNLLKILSRQNTITKQAYIDVYVRYLSPKALTTPEFFNIILDSAESHFKNYRKYLNTITEDFLNENPHNIASFLLLTFNKNNIKTNKSYKTFSWFHDKKSAINLLTIINNHNKTKERLDIDQLFHLYNQLSPELKIDKDVIKSFIDYKSEMCEILFTNLPKEVFSDCSILNHYLIKNKSISFITTEFLVNCENQFLLEKYFSVAANFNTLNKPEFSHIRTNIKYMKNIFMYNKVPYSSTELEFMYDSLEDKYDFYKFMHNNASLYPNLPEKLKLNPEFNINILNTHTNANIHLLNYVEQFPKELFNQIEFCVSLWKENYSLIKFIPENMWSKKQFLLPALQVIDDTQSKDKQNKYKEQLPDKIKNIISSYSVSRNYSLFFSNFIINHELNNNLPDKNKTKKNKI